MYRAKSVQIFESNWKFLNEQTIPFNFFKKNINSIFIPYCPFYKLKLVISKYGSRILCLYMLLNKLIDTKTYSFINNSFIYCKLHLCAAY